MPKTPEQILSDAKKKPTKTPAEILGDTTPEVDETTWLEAVGGLRPDRLGASFAKGAWETVKGIPGLPGKRTL